MTDSNPHTILIVEDDYAIRFVLEQYLELEGYKTLAAENGAEALEILKTTSPPNLILLDMMMPVMTGWEFAIAYDRLFGRQSPIVVMTAAADAARRATDINADGVISKPFELDAMLSIIKKYEK